MVSPNPETIMADTRLSWLSGFFFINTSVPLTWKRCSISFKKTFIQQRPLTFQVFPEFFSNCLPLSVNLWCPCWIFLVMSSDVRSFVMLWNTLLLSLCCFIPIFERDKKELMVLLADVRIISILNMARKNRPTERRLQIRKHRGGNSFLQSHTRGRSLSWEWGGT